MNEQGLADLHLTEHVRSQETHRRCGAASASAVVRSDGSGVVEVAAHVFVADERADVVDRREIAEAAREDELGAVVGEHVVGVLAERLVELGLGLPDGHELDRRRRSPSPPIAGSFGSGVLAASSSTTRSRRSIRAPPRFARIERLADEVLEQDGEHDTDSALVAERSAQVQRVRRRM